MIYNSAVAYYFWATLYIICES